MTFSPSLLGERIKTARQARGLSQKQLADLAGIGKTAMFDLQHGNPGVRLSTLSAVLGILDISLRLEERDALHTSTPLPVPHDESLPDHLL